MAIRLNILGLAFLVSSVSIAQYNPKDIALLGGQGSGEIVLGAFLAQQGVSAQHYLAANHWETSIVDSFKIAIIRDSSVIFLYLNKTNKWDSTVVLKFRDLKVDDRVLIYDIRARWLNMPSTLLQPLEFIIK
jgi:hypothetical protein